MATRIGKEENSIAMLEHLIALDLDAMRAYDAAIRRLDNEEWRRQLADFRADHARHVVELRPIVRDLGGDPPTEADRKAILTKGKVVLADLAGDTAILRAMQSNEKDTHAAYSLATGRPDVPDYVHALLSRNEGDEHRHRAWIEATLRMQS